MCDLTVQVISSASLAFTLKVCLRNPAASALDLASSFTAEKSGFAIAYRLNVRNLRDTGR